MRMRRKSSTPEHPNRLGQLCGFSLDITKRFPFYKRQEHCTKSVVNLGCLFLSWRRLQALGCCSRREAKDVISQEAIPTRNQAAEYEAAVPKTIVELQQFRQTSSIRIRSDAGQREWLRSSISIRQSTRGICLRSPGRTALNSPIIWKIPNRVLED